MCSSPVETLAASVYAAISIYLPDIEYDRKIGDRTIKTKRRPRSDEIHAYHFPQSWSSTALGFGGIGGQAFTTAYTTVIITDKDACVFFNGTHAYTVINFNESLETDVSLGKMEPVNRANKYSRI